MKNYADYLFVKAGGAILSWVIDGAKKVIEDEYKITTPQRVEDAIMAYKENNDWLSHFLDDRCEVGIEYSEKSGELYNEYRTYCIQTGEFIRSTADFYSALETEGFTKFRNNKGRYIKGLKLKSEFLPED